MIKIDRVQNLGSDVSSAVQKVDIEQSSSSAAEKNGISKEYVEKAIESNEASKLSEQKLSDQEQDAEISNAKDMAASKPHDFDDERIKKALKEINKNLEKVNTEAIFGYHEDTNRIIIKMVDKETKEVIKEFPSEKTLDMIAKVRELAGIMVDEKG